LKLRLSQWATTAALDLAVLSWSATLPLGFLCFLLVGMLRHGSVAFPFDWDVLFWARALSFTWIVSFSTVLFPSELSFSFESIRFPFDWRVDFSIDTSSVGCGVYTSTLTECRCARARQPHHN
jgi:hypothetical protein